MDTPQDEAWESLKRSLPIDAEVSGVVTRKEHYGAWLDLGVGFPALLEIIVMDGLTPERYHTGDWCPVGSTIAAFVGGFRDDNRQVYLYQRKPEWITDRPGQASGPISN